ncbi:UPF0488 protein CG14286 [Diorhabda sublineata]|uniref:UPF0488 protein CG14286 n=1 Tax=Diorhabda sublineata TaxID=1163346 RepID=UPI0024E0EA85|nr:UPF0488 protein CG14286 [Diorhabda sublineata]
MPPNKLKLHKTTGKNTSILQKTIENTPGYQASSSNVEISNEEKFEIELYWCVQQLQKALSSGKLNNKQVQDHTKSLNILMSNTAPVIKKRQVMRMAFGDYREKMATEEKKLSKSATNMKLKPATANKKTVFLKKSVFTSNLDNSFKFNFNIDDSNSEEIEKVNANGEEQKHISNDNTKNFHFVPSNNSFRFGFNVEDEL